MGWQKGRSGAGGWWHGGKEPGGGTGASDGSADADVSMALVESVDAPPLLVAGVAVVAFCGGCDTAVVVALALVVAAAPADDEDTEDDGEGEEEVEGAEVAAEEEEKEEEEEEEEEEEGLVVAMTAVLAVPPKAKQRK